MEAEVKESLQQLVADLSSFVESDEDLVLVFDVTDHEVPYIFNALDSVDGQSPSHVFLSFAHPVRCVGSYLGAIFESVQTQLEGVNAIRAQDQLEPWPPLPSECLDSMQPASGRLTRLVEYLRAQLPTGGEHRIVLSLLPSTIEDRAAYAQVVRGIFPQGMAPWMPLTRVLLRDDRNARFLSQVDADGVVFYDGLDFSPAAAAASLLDAAKDPDTPQDRRMMAFVQLAAIDFSHRRYGESFRKWRICFDYYTQVEVDSMRGLCLCGAADVLRETGKLDEAKAMYQRGIGLPPSQEMLPVTLNLLLGIAQTCIRMEDWVDAEGYLDMADQVASKLCQVYPKCEVMERQGFVFAQQDKFGEAMTRWRAAVDLSKELQIFDICERALRGLIDLFERAQMHDERRSHQRELEEVRLAARVAAHQAEAEQA